MSAAARISGKIHKWLALLMAIQILFWFASGLFFAAVPIERVRSEHQIADAAPVAVDMGQAAAALSSGALEQAASAREVAAATVKVIRVMMRLL